MTYFPLRQTTCFFIPLVAPCKPLLHADKVIAYLPERSEFEIIQHRNVKDVREITPLRVCSPPFNTFKCAICAAALPALHPTEYFCKAT